MSPASLEHAEPKIDDQCNIRTIQKETPMTTDETGSQDSDSLSGMGMVGGAAAGAAAGSMAGPIGAAVGAVVGGVAVQKQSKLRSVYAQLQRRPRQG